MAELQKKQLTFERRRSMSEITDAVQNDAVYTSITIQGLRLYNLFASSPPMASVNRGHVVLQPTYFTSSVYVKALRDDITTLVHNFHEQYKEDDSKPFALFKSLWNAQGWKWMHFRVFDSRTRETFLNVTARLFLGAHGLAPSTPR
jgi:hypothetical protein